MTEALTPSLLQGGALLLDKPAGISSAQALEELKRAARSAPAQRPSPHPPDHAPRLKWGHGGTLDPFATGLLLVLVGEGVKLAQYFLHSRKSYEGWIRFGESTPSGDPTLPVHERCRSIPQSLAEVQSAARSFTASAYWQEPPMFSAKKSQGQPLYKLARQGLEIERDPVLRQIFHFEILELTQGRGRFQVTCSSGTYIRVLASDLAKKMQTLALLDSLRRTQSGSFTLAKAQALPDLAQALATPNGPPASFIPFSQLLPDFPRIEVTAAQRLALFRGQQAVLGSLSLADPLLPALPLLAGCYYENELVAVVRSAPDHQAQAQPKAPQPPGKPELSSLGAVDPQPSTAIPHHRWQLERCFPDASFSKI